LYIVVAVDEDTGLLGVVTVASEETGREVEVLAAGLLS
jgi:hypothetical protein